MSWADSQADMDLNSLLGPVDPDDTFLSFLEDLDKPPRVPASPVTIAQSPEADESSHMGDASGESGRSLGPSAPSSPVQDGWLDAPAPAVWPPAPQQPAAPQAAAAQLVAPQPVAPQLPAAVPPAVTQQQDRNAPMGQLSAVLAQLWGGAELIPNAAPAIAIFGQAVRDVARGGQENIDTRSRHDQLRLFMPVLAASVGDTEAATSSAPASLQHLTALQAWPGLRTLGNGSKTLIELGGAGGFAHFVVARLAELRSISNTSGRNIANGVAAGWVPVSAQTMREATQQLPGRLNRTAFKSPGTFFAKLAEMYNARAGDVAVQAAMAKLVLEHNPTKPVAPLAVVLYLGAGRAAAGETFRAGAGGTRAFTEAIARLMAGAIFLCGWDELTVKGNEGKDGSGPSSSSSGKKRRKKDGDAGGGSGGGGTSSSSSSNFAAAGGPGVAGLGFTASSEESFEVVNADVGEGESSDEDDLGDASDSNNTSSDDDDDDDDEGDQDGGGGATAAQAAPVGQVAAMRGVSASLLLRWTCWLRAQVGADRFESMTAYDAVNGLDAGDAWSVCGLTSDANTCLADLLQTQAGTGLREALAAQELKAAYSHDDEEKWFGRADAFLSHAWESPLTALEAALETLASDEDPLLWLDIFAVAQNSNEGPEARQRRLLPDTKAVLETCPKGLLLLAHPWNAPAALRRTWCWVEAAIAIERKRPVALALPPADAKEIRELGRRCCAGSGEEDADVKQVVRMLQDTSVLRSACSRPDDKPQLLTFIEASGGSDNVDRLVKGAVADLLLAAADALVDGGQASPGAAALVGAVAAASGTGDGVNSAVHANKLARLHVTLGWYGDATQQLTPAVNALRARLAELGNSDPEQKRVLLRELALTLTLRGRSLGDSGDLASVNAAVADLVLSARLRGALADPGLPEALYNLGRALVLYYESFPANPLGRDRTKDLRCARGALERSIAIQERERNVEGPVGAAYVLLSKVLDQDRENDEAASLTLLERGKEVQLEAYGLADARWAMTEQSIGWHLLQRGRHAQAASRIMSAHAYLARRCGVSASPAAGASASVACPPVRIVYLLNMLRQALQGAQRDAAQAERAVPDAQARNMVREYATEARRFLRWLAVADPRVMAQSSPEVASEIADLRRWIEQEAAPDGLLVAVRDEDKRDVLLKALRKLQNEERSDWAGSSVEVVEEGSAAMAAELVAAAPAKFAVVFVDGDEALPQLQRRDGLRVCAVADRDEKFAEAEEGSDKAEGAVTRLQMPLSKNLAELRAALPVLPRPLLLREL